MIKLTRLNHTTFYLNPDLVKTVEETPDTVIRLVNDEHFLVLEKVAEVIESMVAFRVEVLKRAHDPRLLLEPRKSFDLP